MKYIKKSRGVWSKLEKVITSKKIKISKSRARRLAIQMKEKQEEEKCLKDLC